MKTMKTEIKKSLKNKLNELRKHCTRFRDGHYNYYTNEELLLIYIHSDMYIAVNSKKNKIILIFKQ